MSNHRIHSSMLVESVCRFMGCLCHTSAKMQQFSIFCCTTMESTAILEVCAGHCLFVISEVVSQTCNCVAKQHPSEEGPNVQSVCFGCWQFFSSLLKLEEPLRRRAKCSKCLFWLVVVFLVSIEIRVGRSRPVGEPKKHWC